MPRAQSYKDFTLTLPAPTGKDLLFRYITFRMKRPTNLTRQVTFSFAVPAERQSLCYVTGAERFALVYPAETIGRLQNLLNERKIIRAAQKTAPWR